MGTWGFGAFENDDASDTVGGITSELEAELVNFVHRVRFTYAMHYHRARAAAVILTTFATVGLKTWSPPEDATAPLIEQAFRAYFQAVPGFEPQHREAIEADVVEFVRVFANPDVIVAPPVEADVAGALRALGAEPAAWSWARFGFDFADAWKHSATPPRRTPQVALAAGVDAETMIRAISETLLREAKATKRSRLDVRNDLVELLEKLAGGASFKATRNLTKRIHDASKVEGEALMKRFRARAAGSVFTSDPEDDPLQDVLFQTKELAQIHDAATTLGAMDPYRAGDFVEKLVRDAKATDVLGTLRAKLEPAVLAAAKQRATEMGDEVSIPIGTVYRKGPKH
jgi:hypothetical protein